MTVDALFIMIAQDMVRPRPPPPFPGDGVCLLAHTGPLITHHTLERLNGRLLQAYAVCRVVMELQC